jgi:hypothetical protein
MTGSATRNSDTTISLVVTALGAAITGAALGIAAMKYLERSKKPREIQQLQYHIPQQHRNSLVFDESEHGASTKTILLPHNHEEKMRRQIAARALVEEDNFHPRDSVTVRVPATSANMGPGCTCF